MSVQMLSSRHYKSLEAATLLHVCGKDRPGYSFRYKYGSDAKIRFYFEKLAELNCAVYNARYKEKGRAPINWTETPASLSLAAYWKALSSVDYQIEMDYLKDGGTAEQKETLEDLRGLIRSIAEHFAEVAYEKEGADSWSL